MQFGVIGGAAVAAVGTFLEWVKVSAGGFSVKATGWDGDLADDLSVGKIIKAGVPIDAILIVVLGAAILYFLLGPMLGMQVPAVPFATVGLGALIAALGIWNYLTVKDQIDKIPGSGASVGLGIYIVIVGGAAAAICAFLDQQQRAKMM